MSLEDKKEKKKDDGYNVASGKTTSKSKERVEAYQGGYMVNLIKQAELNERMGFELTPEQRFAIENKSYLLRRQR